MDAELRHRRNKVRNKQLDTGVEGPVVDVVVRVVYLSHDVSVAGNFF